MGIFCLPVFAAKIFGKRGDVLFRFGNGGAKRFIRLQRRAHKFCLRHGELVGRKFCAIKFLREAQHRAVATHENVVQNRLGTLFNLDVEQTGIGGNFAELRGKSLSVERTIFIRGG